MTTIAAPGADEGDRDPLTSETEVEGPVLMIGDTLAPLITPARVSTVTASKVQTVPFGMLVKLRQVFWEVIDPE